MAAGKEIKRLRGNVSAQEAASLIGVDVEKMRKWEQRDADPKDSGDIKAVEDYFGCKLSDLNKLDKFQFIPKNKLTEFSLKDLDQSQPIIQVVLNLSFIGKKNAETMDRMSVSVDRMAATNQRNTEIIAALVGSILPNSKLAAQLTTSLSDPHKGGEGLTVEDFLPENSESLKGQLKSGKKASRGN